MNLNEKTLTFEQEKIKDKIKNSFNMPVVLKGSWGTGKTTVISKYISETYPKKIILKNLYHFNKRNPFSTILFTIISLIIFVPRLIFSFFIIPHGKKDASNFFHVRLFGILASFSFLSPIPLLTSLALNDWKIDNWFTILSFISTFLYIISVFIWYISPKFLIKMFTIKNNWIWIENIDRSFNDIDTYKILNLCEIFSESGIKIIYECTDIKSSTMMNQLEKYAKEFIDYDKIVSLKEINKKILDEHNLFSIFESKISISKIDQFSPRILQAFLRSNGNYVRKLILTNAKNIDLDSVITYNQIMWYWPHLSWIETAPEELFSNYESILKIEQKVLCDLVYYFASPNSRFIYHHINKKSLNGSDYPGIINHKENKVQLVKIVMESFNNINKVFKSKNTWNEITLNKNIVLDKNDLDKIDSLSEFVYKSLFTKETLIKNPKDLFKYTSKLNDFNQNIWSLRNWVEGHIIGDEKQISNIINWTNNIINTNYKTQNLNDLFMFKMMNYNIFKRYSKNYNLTKISKHIIEYNNLTNDQAEVAMTLDEKIKADLLDMSNNIYAKSIKNRKINDFISFSTISSSKESYQLICFRLNKMLRLKDEYYDEKIMIKSLIELKNIHIDLPALMFETMHHQIENHFIKAISFLNKSIENKKVKFSLSGLDNEKEFQKFEQLSKHNDFITLRNNVNKYIETLIK